MLHVMQDRTVQFIGTKKTGHAVDLSNNFRVAPVQVSCTLQPQAVPSVAFHRCDIARATDTDGPCLLVPLAGLAALTSPPMLLVPPALPYHNILSVQTYWFGSCVQRHASSGPSSVKTSVLSSTDSTE